MIRAARLVPVVLLVVVTAGCLGSTPDAPVSGNGVAGNGAATLVLDGDSQLLAHSTCDDHAAFQAYAYVEDGTTSLLLTQDGTGYTLTIDDDTTHGGSTRVATSAGGLTFTRTGGVVSVAGPLDGEGGATVDLSLPCPDAPDHGSGTAVIDGTTETAAAVECLGRDDGSLAVQATIGNGSATPVSLRLERRPGAAGVEDRVVLVGGTEYVGDLVSTAPATGDSTHLLGASGVWTLAADGTVTLPLVTVASSDGATTATVSANLACGLYAIVPTH